MSCIKLVLTDQEQTISGEIHSSLGGSVIAALSAEPETIHELELALARFVRRQTDWSPFGSFHVRESSEPSDAGIVIVDLAARVIMLDSTQSVLEPIAENADSTEGLDFDPELDVFMWSSETDTGDNQKSTSPTDPDAPVTYEIAYHDGEKLTDVRLPYRLPGDWLLVYSVPEYEFVCRRRRAERSGIQWFDPRTVLFGKQLSEFVASEIAATGDLDNAALLTEIHVKWLVSPRDDLQGKSPRELLLEKKESIDFDLHSRELQWSLTDECPPPLLSASHSYRFAGFGTHEIVIYYDLFRFLLEQCGKRAQEEKQVSLADETERLEGIKSAWLETPSSDCQGKTPALVIEWERKRMPLAMSGAAAMVDEDCPICRAMAEDLETPIFWHLDNCNMEDQFEFSDFKSREEWEADRRRREEFNREFERKWKARAGKMLVNEALTADEDGPLH